MTRPKVITYIQDVITYFLGWALILKQAGIFFAPPAQVSETLTWAGIALISGTGIAQLVSRRFGIASDGESRQSPEQSAQSSSALDDRREKP